jgi:hypothetical protein
MTPLAAVAIFAPTGLEKATSPMAFALVTLARVSGRRSTSGEVTLRAFALLRGLAFLRRLVATMAPRGRSSVTRPVRYAVVMVALLPFTTNVTSHHCVQCAVALVRMAVREAIIGRDVEREGFNLAHVLVE